MGRTRNPFTNRLDYTGSGGGGTGEIPATGTGSPEGVVDSLYAGYEYIDTNTGVKYTNPNASGNVGREIVQTSPAI